MEENPSSSKADRKTIERNRRSQMKNLYSKLHSLVPHHKAGSISLPDQLDEAAKYIKKTQIKLEKMKEKRDTLLAIKNPNKKMNEILISQNGKSLQVVLITGLSNNQSIFNQIISILHQEKAEITSACFSTLNESVFHTIHSKIGESESDDGAARLIGSLKKLVHDSNNNSF